MRQNINIQVGQIRVSKWAIPEYRTQCSLVGELRVPARVSSLSMQPSPLSGRVGVHITTFEACSSFTRVTACRVARLPYVSFIARLHPNRFPGSGTRKLPKFNQQPPWVGPSPTGDLRR